MNTRKLKQLLLTTAFVAIFSALPGTSQALTVTDQAIYQLTETTVIYKLSFQFGFLNRHTELPIAATRLTAATTTPQLTFSLFENESDLVSTGRTSAIILASSEAEVRNNRYFVPAAERADFILWVLHEAPTALTPNSIPTLEVTHLPMILTDPATNVAEMRRLDEPYLSTYRVSPQ